MNDMDVGVDAGDQYRRDSGDCMDLNTWNKTAVCLLSRENRASLKVVNRKIIYNPSNLLP
jgi:hypothetical protein